MTYKLNVPFNESGYSFEEIAQNIRDETQGGLSRSRADLDDIRIGVSLSFTISGERYQELQNFWKVGTQRGSVSFYQDLIIDNATLTQFECFFASGLRLTGANGDNYTVSATIEVIPAANDAAFDAAICAVYEASGGIPDAYLNGFAKIIEALPSA